MVRKKGYVKNYTILNTALVRPGFTLIVVPHVGIGAYFPTKARKLKINI